MTDMTDTTVDCLRPVLSATFSFLCLLLCVTSIAVLSMILKRLPAYQVRKSQVDGLAVPIKLKTIKKKIYIFF